MAAGAANEREDMATSVGGESGGDYGEDGRGSRGDTELASKQVKIQSKRFYLDLKHNDRGKFIKIAEVPGGTKDRKNKVIFAIRICREFRDHLTTFAEFLADEESSNKAAPEDGLLKTEKIRGDSNRQYYLDLKENDRGRFLRVSQTGLRMGMRGSRGRGGRNQIVIPAQGIVDIRNAVTEFLDEYGSDEEESSSELPGSRELRVEQKRFYFDVGSNPRGVFLKVSEVTPNYRTSITIPKRGWGRVRDIFDDFCKKTEGDEDDEEDDEEEEEDGERPRQTKDESQD